jgi:hypothetical protein
MDSKQLQEIRERAERWNKRITMLKVTHETELLDQLYNKDIPALLEHIDKMTAISKIAKETLGSCFPKQCSDCCVKKECTVYDLGMLLAELEATP